MSKNFIKIKNLNHSYAADKSGPSSVKEFFSSFLLKKNNKPNVVKQNNQLINIDLSIGPKDKLGILGRNGAGKSTLLKLIAGVYYDEHNSITINGRISPLLELGAGFHADLTGRENIYLNSALLGIPKELVVNLEEEIIIFSGLSNVIDNPIRTYSSGMYMRLGLSIALHSSADIFILDEIFSGGDQNFLKKSAIKMKEIITNSKITLIVSHDEDIIRNNCNRAIVLDKGQIVFDGSVNKAINIYKKIHEALI